MIVTLRPSPSPVLSVDTPGWSVRLVWMMRRSAGGMVTQIFREPDGHVADQGIEIGLSEYLRYQAHIGVDHNALAVGGGYSGALLPAVLQGEKPEESQTAGLSFGGKDPYHPAFFVGVIKWNAAEGKFQTCFC